MNTEIIYSVDEFIENQLKSYNLNNKTLQKMENICKNKIKYGQSTLKIIIKNNKITFDTFPISVDNRTGHYKKLLLDTLNYIKKKNKRLTDCVLYLFISDSYNFEHQDLPFFIFSRPENKRGILLPDNSFKCHTIDNKCFDWKETKTIVKKHCDLPIEAKKKQIYFRGGNTGSDKHNLRKKMEKATTNNDIYNITVGSFKIPLYKFCHYKYLLNLPGHQPWSYRFKYLFLMKGLVINISLLQHYPYSSEPNSRWINFLDNIFVEDKDYININFDWYEHDENKNSENFDELVKKIDDIYDNYENNSDDDNQEKYLEMVNNGYEKASSITMELVYECIFKTINAYADKFD
jgi:hypothetical protein